MTKRKAWILYALSAVIWSVAFALVLQPSDARRSRPRADVFPLGNSATVQEIGEATFGQTWDWFVAADTINAVQDAGIVGAWPYEPDGGTLPAAHTDGGLSTGYQSSAGLSAAGLGTRLVNQGVSLNGAIWRRASLVNTPGYSGNGFQSLIRIVFVHEAGASGTAGVLASSSRSGTGGFIVYAQSTTQFRILLQSNTSYSSIVAAPHGISVGPHVLTIYTSDSENVGSLNRLNSEFWLDGEYVGGAEHTGDTTAWPGNLADQLSVGGTAGGASPLLGRTIFFVGYATGNNFGWWNGYDTEYRHCVRLGLCPNMGAGASAGTGRGLPQGDGGILNIIQPSGFVADGRTRTGWAVVTPAVYNPSVPTDLYVHFCGCSWTGASCRGSFVGGSAATADPNLEAGDPNGIHIYAEPLYADPTDCAAAGGGNGWPKSNTRFGDFQVQYAMALLAHARQHYAVRATHCVGRSNGSAFCHYLGMRFPGLFSSIADTIGYLPGTANGGGPALTSSITQGRNPVYAMHMVDDPTVGINFARNLVPFYLERNLGIDAGTNDGSIGTCVGMDAGGRDGGQIITGCGCGGSQGTYDGGANGICCTWTTAGGGLDGGPALPFQYCEARVGGHLPPGGEGERIRTFVLNYAEDAGG